MNTPPITTEKKGISRRLIFSIAMALVAFGLGLGAGYLAWGRNVAALKVELAAANQKVATQAAQAPQPQKVKRYDVPTDNDPAIGLENAPITLIEFSDYECPYCQKWHLEVFSRIRQDYPDKVRIVYRDFPLPNHSNSVPAAEAADCANEQGAFWEFHDRLFSMQYGLNASAYKRYASDIGLDVAKFEECVSTRRYKDEVQGDLDYASNLGVGSTPTFFLNGIPVVGAQPYELFKQVIDKELAGEIP